MTKESNLKLPIGYWLKQADKTLTEQINQAQAVHDVSRTGWQILKQASTSTNASSPPKQKCASAPCKASAGMSTPPQFASSNRWSKILINQENQANQRPIKNHKSAQFA